MSVFTTPCPHCQNPTIYDASIAGVAVRCAACHNQFTMPTPIVNAPVGLHSSGSSAVTPARLERAYRMLVLHAWLMGVGVAAAVVIAVLMGLWEYRFRKAEAALEEIQQQFDRSLEQIQRRR